VIARDEKTDPHDFKRGILKDLPKLAPKQTGQDKFPRVLVKSGWVPQYTQLLPVHQVGNKLYS
jgi:hypothetical protein